MLLVSKIFDDRCKLQSDSFRQAQNSGISSAMNHIKQ